MVQTIFKSIAIGLVFGAAVWLMGGFVIAILLVAALFRIFGRRRFGHGYGHRHFGYRMAFADKIRNMDDEEYAAFKDNFGRGCYDRRRQTNSSEAL